MTTHRTGNVAIVGRPNVGKSTLLNRLVETKVAIVTPKPQTTRTRVVGIRTLADAQLAFIDTPGIHAARSTLNRRMVAVAEQALAEADVLLWVIDAEARLSPMDRKLADAVARRSVPAVVVLNKLDRVRPPALLPLMAEIGAWLPGRDVIPASARTGEGLDRVLAAATAALPTGAPRFAEDEYTTESARFLVQELVREQVFLQTAEEVPYGTAVVIERWAERPDTDFVSIAATILVDRTSHKAIVVGAGGRRLREIGRRARLGLEAQLGVRAYLELFVRVERWSENPGRLREMGL